MCIDNVKRKYREERLSSRVTAIDSSVNDDKIDHKYWQKLSNVARLREWLRQRFFVTSFEASLSNVRRHSRRWLQQGLPRRKKCISLEIERKKKVKMCCRACLARNTRVIKRFSIISFLDHPSRMALPKLTCARLVKFDWIERNVHVPRYTSSHFLLSFFSANVSWRYREEYRNSEG